MLRRLSVLALLPSLLVLTPTIAKAEEGTTLQLPCLRDEPSAEAPSSTAVCGRFVDYVHAVQAGQWFETVAANVRAEAARSATPRRVVTQRPAVSAPSGSGSVNGHPCGGALPSCYILNRESHGTNAENPTSSASGYWQFIDSTWNGYGGYAHASDAPASVQDAKAAEVWAGGAGAGHWACC